MKKFFKVLGIVAALVVVAVVGFVVWVQTRGIPKYDIPQPTVAITPAAATPEVLAQGEKLVLTDCYACHINKQTNVLSGHLLYSSRSDLRLDDVKPKAHQGREGWSKLVEPVEKRKDSGLERALGPIKLGVDNLLA